MVQGVDVWLNTPRRPLEASGTSGMKATFNAALNLSILDGWWDEAYSPEVGWAIGKGEEYQDLDYQDRVEAGTLYDLLEHEVVPLFYTRGADGLPRGWIDLMKSAMSALCPVFNTNRMVHQYTLEGYRPAQARRDQLESDGFRRARALAAWRRRVRDAWPQLSIGRIETDVSDPVRVGGTCEVRARVRLGPLSDRDVAVQLYVGRVDENQQIVGGEIQAMVPEGRPGAEGLLFRARLPWTMSGRQGLTVRVLPHHEDLSHPLETGLITWAP
jgi:starch phosphorylase